MPSKRQSQILAAIVREYSRKGVPIGSEDLVEKYELNVSSATVRNEMKALEQEGLITQPHTSAGRIPTDEGYRFFVNNLMRHLELTATEQERLRRELQELQQQYLELGRSLTKLLADHSKGAAFALLPEGVSSSGLSNVFDADAETQEVKEVVKFFDELSEHQPVLMKKTARDIETFIGQEAPIPLSKNYSMIVNKVNLPGGKQGVLGIIGPKRMKYAKNVSLLEYLSKLLLGGSALLIIYLYF